MENREIENEIVVDKKTRSKPQHIKKEEYKEKECKVIRYNRISKTLDIKFDKFGIKVRNVDFSPENETITIKYKGEIGKPNFMLKV